MLLNFLMVIFEPMKKVLILAYDFPPYVSVGGLRPYSWYKYFHEFGLYPIVVTRQWGNKYGSHLDYIAPGETNETIIEENQTGTIIRTPYKPNLSNRLLLKYGEKRFRLLRKVITAWYEFMQFLFLVGPKAGLYRGTKAYLKQHKVDAIIATGEPFILFKYASKLSGKFNIPWLADYRDPWTQSKSRSKNILLKVWNSCFEKKYINNSSRIITVSDFLKYKIQQLIKGKEILIVPNGYNDHNKTASTKQSSDILKVALAGSIYPWHPVKSVLSAFHNYLSLKGNANIKLTFIGTSKNEYISRVVDNEYIALMGKVSFLNKIPNQELLAYLKNQDLLLLFNDYSITGTKIYDYLAAKTRILLCYTNDEDALKLKNKYFPINDEGYNKNRQAEIIEYTHSGYLVKNQKEFTELLESIMNEYIAEGKLHCESKNVEEFSRKRQVEKLTDIINKIQ
ncbi:hypothetical protein L21SP5_01956 [Salinivirga cyanobacteriivorans]|uniref:Glycosyltransferase subfamily 4-like N-terminal domain-containing protein n=2 Tax=Salinivirga cyanobacteriivorans TaxID=1307839 RepID=A0A0S2HZZ6_9BACT|nr:hypothetical protein L21SP5_01956 [Salinivirga cyanobacteriivorans]